MHVKGLTNLSLLYHRCECGELNVGGSWGQLEKMVVGQSVYVKLPCRKCERYRVRKFALTTDRHRPLLPWLTWLVLGVRYLPRSVGEWLFRHLMLPAFWLERRVPI